MSNRCLTLILTELGGVRTFYRQIPVYVDFAAYIRALHRVGGFSEFQKHADELLEVVGSESLRFMRDTDIGFKFIIGHRSWGNTDLYTGSGELLCRASTFDEVRNFLFFHAYDAASKRARLTEYIYELSTNHALVFDAKKASILAGREIPPSATGLAPDYSTLTDVLYAGNPANGKVRIKLTGVLSKDFELANAQVGLLKTPKTHVWHHLDDWDPVTGECTLQLVDKILHAKASTGTTHTGGTALWRYFYQVRKYK